MAILDSEKLDFLWKKLLFGVTKTAKSADKAGSNEILPSPVTVLPSSIWADADLIPAFAPATDAGVVKVFTGAQRIAATTDPTSTPSLTWLATTTPDDITTCIGDFIPPTFGSSYAVKVFIGDPDGGPAARLFPDTTGEEWVFDYTAGVLIFASDIPDDKPASIGSGTVSIATHGIFLEVCQYAGTRGFAPPVLDGFAMTLGDIAAHGDGAWEPGAVPLENTTPVSEAVDRLNEVLGKLVPAQPPMFPNGALSIANTAGSSPRLAVGYTRNAGSPLTPGTAVSRITSATLTTSVLGDVGPGDVGVLSATLNGEEAAAYTLTGSGDNGAHGGVTVADQKDYPAATPGFWKSIDVGVSGLAVPVGLNTISLAHSGAGQTNVVTFMRDDMMASPVISDVSLEEASAGTLAYSSGVPHYGDGASLTVGMSIANLAGETYYGGSDPVQFTGPVIASKTCAYTDDLGVDAPLARNTVAKVAITPQTIAVDGSGHLSGKVSGVARNVNGSATLDLGGPTILIKRGAAAGKIDEGAISAFGATAVRKGLGAGDTPAGVPAAWAGDAALPTHEAAVVAGVLAHNRTNYAAGYLPVGPNLSTGRDGAQYATFSFSRAALSAFKISVTGAYAGCWIKLPGASDQTAAPAGWWNGFKPYDGAGVPGEAGDPDAGCALGAVMSGGSGTFQITFGTQSSTNATGNEILVRFKLNPGQSITALSFNA